MFTDADCSGELTAREAEVMNLVADGLLNKQIARRLQISVNTVKNHLHCAFLKLGAGNRAAAAAAWVRRHRRDRGAREGGDGEA